MKNSSGFNNKTGTEIKPYSKIPPSSKYINYLRVTSTSLEINEL